MHIILIVTWSDLLYHVQLMRSYHRITQDAKHQGWSNGITSSTRCWLYPRSSYYYNNIPFFSDIILILLIILVLIQKNEGKFAFTLRFLTLCHHVFRLWFHAWNLRNVMSPQKQVTDISLILKGRDTGSESLSSLIWLSESDGQKTDCSKDGMLLPNIWYAIILSVLLNLHIITIVYAYANYVIKATLLQILELKKNDHFMDIFVYHMSEKYRRHNMTMLYPSLC